MMEDDSGHMSDISSATNDEDLAYGGQVRSDDEGSIDSYKTPPTKRAPTSPPNTPVIGSKEDSATNTVDDSYELKDQLLWKLTSANMNARPSKKDIDHNCLEQEFKKTSIGFLNKRTFCCDNTLNLECEIAAKYFKMKNDLGELVNSDENILLVFSTELESNTYMLTAHGSDSSKMERCLERMKSLLRKILSEDGHIFTPLKFWKSQHVLALRGSKHLIELQSKCRTICQFHCSSNLQSSSMALREDRTALENAVCVETVSASAAELNCLLSHISCMHPRHLRWDLPLQLVPANYACLSGFDVYIDIGLRSDEMQSDVPVEVWGFDGEPEQALEVLLAAHSSNPIRKLPPISDALHEPLLLEIPSTPPTSTYPPEPPALRRGPPAVVQNLDKLSALSKPLQAFPLTNGSFESLSLSHVPKTEEMESPMMGPGYLPAAAPMREQNERDSSKLEKIFLYKSSYSFQDREAGIYYQAFEHAFAQTLRYGFGVTVAAIEGAEDCTGFKVSLPSKFSQNSDRFSASARTPRSGALRVDVYGNTNKDCQAAIAYIAHALCSSHLSRTIIYFPKAEQLFYKKLYEAKEARDRINAAERERDASSRRKTLKLPAQAEVVQNPMHADGFINIRIKPPINSRGLRRMTFPADVSITVCGPAFTLLQREAIKRCEQVFRNIPSDYYVANVEVSSLNPQAKVITPRASRDLFVRKHGLVAIRIDETARRISNGTECGSVSPSGSVATAGSGLAGLATIWAPTKKSLDRVLALIAEGEQEAKHTAQLKAQSMLHFRIGPNDIGECDDIIDAENTPFPPDAPMPDAALLANAPTPALLSPNKTFAEAASSHIIIHWPHASCKFIFLEQTTKNALSYLINGYREIGVKITTPYRDKKDASVCMLIESADEFRSPNAAVNVQRAANAVREYMATVADKIKAVQLVVSSSLLSCLKSDDLAELKNMQGLYGVHILIEPASEDVHECSYRMDLTTHKAHPKQLPDPNTCKSIESSFGYNLQLSLRVKNCSTGRPITIQIVNDDSSNWSQYGVSALLLVLDASANATLSAEDIAAIDAGQALVNSDYLRQHMILRVRPTHAWDHAEQADALQFSLLTGLLTADQLRLRGIAVIAPTYNSLLGNMSSKDLKAVTAVTLLSFAREELTRYIQRIVCLEDAEADDERDEDAGKSIGSKSEYSTSKSCSTSSKPCSAIAQAIVLLAQDLEEGAVEIESGQVQPPLLADANAPISMERKSDDSRHHFSSSNNAEHKEAESDCTTPSHIKISMESTQPLITFNDMIYFNDIANKSSRVKPIQNQIVLKGLPNNVLNAINAIWVLGNEKKSLNTDRTRHA